MDDFTLEPRIPILDDTPHPHATPPSRGSRDSKAAAHKRPAHDDRSHESTPPHPKHATSSEKDHAPEPASQTKQGSHAAETPHPASTKTKHKPGKPKKGVRYIPALDGLRALAVLAVIAYHTGLPFCQGGLMGVTVFFVISGYIVTKILLVEFSRTGRINFKDFYIRRIKRLVPAIILVIVTTGALCTLFNHVLLTKMRPEVLPSLFFINNWWQIFNDASYFENIGLPSPLTHFWSLAIEEQFYLVLPITLFCVLKFGGRLRHRRNLSIFLLTLAVLSAVEMTVLYDPTQDPTRVYYGTDTRAFSLLMGAFIAVLTTGAEKRLPKAAREAFAIIGTLGVLGCLGFMDGEEAFTYQGGMVVCSAFTAFLIYGTLWKDSGFVAKFLSLKPFIWIGKRSYGLYLWHYPLVLLFTPVNGGDSLDAIAMVAAIACTFACAELSYRFVENPIRYGIAKKKETALKNEPPSPTPERVHPEAAHATEALQTSAPSQELPIVEGLFDPAAAQKDEAAVPPVEASAESTTPHGLHKLGRLLRNAVPVKPLVAGIVGVLGVVCICGLVFVPDTSALSDDGAAIIIRNSMAGEPLTGEVKLAVGDEEIPTIALEDDSEEDAETDVVYDILMIGDSVALRAVPYFEERFPLGHIDAEKNRRLSQGIEVYRQYAEKGQVGDVVIFALGTNGRLTEEELHEAVDAVGPDKQIYFVTIRSNDATGTEENNRALNAVREAYDNVHLIDWNSLTAAHGDYFDGDGTHLTADAAKIYVQFIADVLQYPPAEEVLAQQEAAEGESSGAESAESADSTQG